MTDIKLHSWVTPKQGVKTLGGWCGNGIVIRVIDDLVAVDPDDGSDVKHFLKDELRLVNVLGTSDTSGPKDTGAVP